MVCNVCLHLPIPVHSCKTVLLLGKIKSSSKQYWWSDIHLRGGLTSICVPWIKFSIDIHQTHKVALLICIKTIISLISIIDRLETEVPQEQMVNGYFHRKTLSAKKMFSMKKISPIKSEQRTEPFNHFFFPLFSSFQLLVREPIL